MNKSNFVNSVGNQVSRGVTYVSNNINAPNYITWSIIPGFIGFIFVALIASVITYNIKTYRQCDKNKKNCEEKELSNLGRILIVIFVSIFSGLIISQMTYKLGVYIKNPKIAMGIETTRYVKDALT